ncbi:hypothetical protein NDU88_000782, partial [Pleurodeles waltl]
TGTSWTKTVHISLLQRTRTPRAAAKPTFFFREHVQNERQQCKLCFLAEQVQLGSSSASFPLSQNGYITAAAVQASLSRRT